MDPRSAAEDDVRLLVKVAATLVAIIATAAASLNITVAIFTVAAASFGAWRYLHSIPYHIPKEHVIAYFAIHFPLYFTPGVGWSALPTGPKCSAEELATVEPGIYYWREPTRIFFGLSPTSMGSGSEVSRRPGSTPPLQRSSTPELRPLSSSSPPPLRLQAQPFDLGAGDQTHADYR